MRLEQEISTHKIVLQGALTIQNVEEVHEQYLAGFCDWPDLLLDLSQVEACDAAGVQWLMSLRLSMSAPPRSFHLIGISEAVSEAASHLGVCFHCDAPDANQTAASFAEQEQIHAQ